MKVNILLSCILFSLLLFNCEEEQTHPREYPRIRTLPVSNISDSGAVFLADLYSLGSEEIIQHGFIWGNTLYPSIVNSERVFLGIPQKEGIYSANIKTTLKKGAKYTVMSFVKTKEHTVFGIPETFTSSGSQAPVITGFEPDSASWGDTIIIRGRNFSWLDKHNVVKLDNIQCETFNTTDTTIFAEIPNSLTLTDKILSVAIDGNIFTFLQRKLKMEKPLLYDFLPKQARWGDTIMIKGRNLRIVDYSTNSVKLGTLKCSLIGLPLDSIVKVQVPYDISTLSNNISVNLNGIVLNGKQNLQLLEPYFTFSTVEGTWGTKIKLVGRFNTIASRNVFYIGNSQAAVSTSEAKVHEIIVPNNLATADSKIKYKVAPFEIVSAESFHLMPPEIISFSPASAPGAATITITGKNFSPSVVPIVKFGDVQASVIVWDKNFINVRTPISGYGPMKITVTCANQTAISSQDFILSNPRISGVNPQTGTFFDLITITGENFIPTGLSVQIGKESAAIVSASSTSIVAKVPSIIDSIPQKIRVTNSNDSYATSAETFTLLPPEIYSVSSTSIVPGSEIIITGKNFNTNLQNEFVTLDMTYLKIKSASPTQLIVQVPQGLPKGSFRLQLKMNGYTKYSDAIFNVSSNWLRIPAPPIRSITADRRILTAIASAGLSNGYLCSLVDGGDTYRFDATSKTWTKLLSKPGSGWDSWYDRKIVCDGALYMVYGLGPIFAVFNEQSETWTTINRSLGYNHESFAFSLNNKIYIGGNPNNPTRYPLYEIDPRQSYSMRSVGYFPTTVNGMPAASFSLNGTCYFLFSNNQVWKFDSSNNSWTRLSNFPGPARTNGLSFVLGSDGYIGTGVLTGVLEITHYNDIWKYNAVNDTWTCVSYMPNARAYATAFTLNGKAYVGFGESDPGSLYDFYEFDPSLVSK